MRALIAFVAGWLMCIAGSVAAQTAYPNRPINLVVPFAAGSGTDSVARFTAHHLGEALSQRVVVDNRAGANGSIAANFVARSAPDGYTLFMTTNTTHSANPSLMKTLSYDPVKDFTPVSRMGNLPFMLVINPGIPAKSVQELVAYGKANPGKLTYASGNSTGIVSGETLKRRAGLDILHVPYKSTPPALADVVSGQVSIMFIDLTTGMPQVKSGGVRPLAVTTRQRTALLPELPSMEEAGVPDFDINSWNGIFAPAGTPAEIVDRLNVEIRKIVAKPEVKARFADMGFDAFSSTPEDLGAFVGSELVKWTKMIKDAGIEPE